MMKSRLNWFKNLGLSRNIFQNGALRTVDITQESTRQGVRRALFNNAFVDAHRFRVPRRNQRKIARQTAKRLWTEKFGPELRETRQAIQAHAERMQKPGLPNPLLTSSEFMTGMKKDRA